MPSVGFYELPKVATANAAFKPFGLEVAVLCASAESGLDFTPHANTPQDRSARQRAYHALGVRLGCIQPIGGRPRLIAPRSVAKPERLPDDMLVRPAVGIGYLDEHNDNPACLGMTIVGKNVAGVGACQAIADAPGTWWAYVDRIKGTPFVMTGILLCVWRCLPRQLVGRHVELIKRGVHDAGGRFDPGKLWVWVSPGGRNKGVLPNGSKQGFSINDGGLDLIRRAGPEFERFLYEGAGTSEDKPHGLDVVGLTFDQILRAGVAREHVGGILEDTVTKRRSGVPKWGSRQAMGPQYVSSVIAGVVRDIRAT